MNKSAIPIVNLIVSNQKRLDRTAKPVLPNENMAGVKHLAPPIDIPVDTTPVGPLFNSTLTAKNTKPEPEDIKVLFHGID